MKQRKQGPSGAYYLAAFSITALAASLAGTEPAVAAAPAGCSIGALEALNIAGMDYTSATDVAASGTTPEYCDVIGTLNTTGEGADPGSAGFEIRLPVTWNGKFLFFGVGGLAGSTYADVATNPVDLAQALSKGYATAITDTGHQAGGTDAAWALLHPGVPDTPKLIDYYYRATHEVTVSGKQLVQAYYKTNIKDAYFDGCSNGGRQAMVEAADFPEDYDGIISGAPFFDIRVIIQGTKTSKALLQSAQSFIPATVLPQVDAAIYAACDAADGVMDGLIQNPGACNIDPHKLSVAGLTKDMTDTLATYWSQTTDQSGGFVYNGYSVSDLDTGTGFDLWGTGFLDPPPNGFDVAEPWGNDGFSPAPIGFEFQDHFLKDIVTRDPNFNLLTFPVSPSGVVQNQALQLFDARTGLGSAPLPDDYQSFIHQGRKLLIYQGFSDPALTPFRTIRLYEQLEQHASSYQTLQGNVRYFLAPGMQHCGGGPGPNTFDTLTVLESWVEQGVAPDGIIAAHYPGNDPTKNPTPDRTMPLCKFPEQAHYNGGNVDTASSWSCNPADQSLLQVGLDGKLAGLSAQDAGH